MRPVQRPEPSGSPPLRSSSQILDSRASRSRAFLRPARQSGGILKARESGGHAAVSRARPELSLVSSARRQGHFQTQAGHLFEPGVGVHEQVEDQPSAYSTSSSHRALASHRRWHKISRPCLVLKNSRPLRLMTREPGWIASSANSNLGQSAQRRCQNCTAITVPRGRWSARHRSPPQ